jgi:hypothetical protein
MNKVKNKKTDWFLPFGEVRRGLSSMIEEIKIQLKKGCNLLHESSKILPYFEIIKLLFK